MTENRDLQNEVHPSLVGTRLQTMASAMVGSVIDPTSCFKDLPSARHWPDTVQAFRALHIQYRSNDVLNEWL